MFGCKSIENPIDLNHKLSVVTDGALVDKERYQRLAWKLIYLSHTRLKYAYSISVVSQFMHSPLEPQMEAIKKMLQYLKDTLRKGMLFSQNGHMDAEAYTDANRGRPMTDKRSTSSYCTLVGGHLVT